MTTLCFIVLNWSFTDSPGHPASVDIFLSSPQSLHKLATSSRAPINHDPQGCLQQAVMGLFQDAVAPALAPACPRPEPGTVLICTHSSSRQSVKHWGKIFCLPEQLLINCPFSDAQDKFCPPPITTLFLTFTMFICTGAPFLPVPLIPAV